jgi:cell division protein FtsB
VLEQRNGRLDAKVTNLKKGFDVIEERARLDLGMIGRNETFFMVVNLNDH